MTAKTALITGITGQDGAYLAHWLLGRGYVVYGTYRPDAAPNLWRLAALGCQDDVRPIAVELHDPPSLHGVINRVEPDEIYHLAAQSSVTASTQQPLLTAEATALGTARLLEILRQLGGDIRFLQASSAEMFGSGTGEPADENTPFRPQSLYGAAKTFAHHLTASYRAAFGIHACSAILFNHESPLRGREYVTRKITRGFASIRYGLLDHLELGDVTARRDWGFAGDYVRAMWLMLNHEVPDDYVIATGIAHSVCELCDVTAAVAGFALEWEGEGAETRAIDRASGRVLVRTDPAFYRPGEAQFLVGEASKARRVLDWRPTVDFETMIEMMVRADLDELAAGERRSGNTRR